MPTYNPQLERQIEVAEQALRENMSLEQARYADRMQKASIKQDNAFKYYEQTLQNESKKERFVRQLESGHSRPPAYINGYHRAKQ
jgi:hypothetical protein